MSPTNHRVRPASCPKATCPTTQTPQARAKKQNAKQEKGNIEEEGEERRKITIGELRRGIELLRHRGDSRQAEQLEEWLEALLSEYQDFILVIDTDIAQLWGRLRVPHPENALDKQIAATALIHDLTVVTRNQTDFRKTGVRVLNPFTE